MRYRVLVGTHRLARHERQVVMDVLASGQISPGRKVAEFEAEFAKRHGGKHGLFVNSGTDALRCAVLACKEKFGWPEGSRVVIPALTFVATANVLLQAGLVPWLCDVSMYDFTMNPDNLVWRNPPANTVAMMPVHVFGRPCRGALYEIAKAAGWWVMEDSCEMMGVEGLRGDVACYSTYACHLLSTGVGGLAVTNDEELKKLMWSYANHGRRYDVEEIEDRFFFERIGYSARATELQAAIGLCQLQELDRTIKARRKIAFALNERLKGFPDLVLPHMTDDEAHAFMMYPIVLREGHPSNKWPLCRFLEEHGIETREMLPLINQRCYAKAAWIDPNGYPVADWVNRNGFYIGCHPGMTEGDVDFIGGVFERYLTKMRKPSRLYGVLGKEAA